MTVEFTIHDLKRILREGAGTDLDGDIADADFTDLGCESLALLETGGRIEREYGITLDEDSLSGARTPTALVELVNRHLVGRPD